MHQLQGKTAFITGAGRGIGLGVARAFAEQGAAVVLAERDADSGKQAEAQINRDFPQGKALFLATDITDRAQLEASIDQAAAEFGTIDILVNNATAGDDQPTKLEHIDDRAITQQVDVNYRASLWAMQKLFPAMQAQGWGRIISLCSLNGVNAHRFSVGYNSSKEALRTLTRTAAAEWGRYGISCNIICPAAATEPWKMYAEFAPEDAANILNQMPMRRMGDTEQDIGPLAVFLASDGARYVTGNTIHADGGGHINGVSWLVDLPE